MNRRVLCASIFSTVCLFLVLPLINMTVEKYVQNRAYVTSQGAKWCYVSGHENGNMKNKLYYKDAKDCPHPLKLK